MIEIIRDLPERVLGLEAVDEVTAEDYRRVLIPELERRLTDLKKVRLFYVLGKRFRGYTGGAAWEDTKVGMKHLSSFERVAVVTDVDWVRNMVKAFGFAMPAEVRVFENDALDRARTWICEPPPKGELRFELIGEKALLILEPQGELEAGDFARLEAEVDPYLSKAGKLQGLMIVAEHFPGWDDFTAFTSHVRFVREHHRKIRKVAFVTDDRLLSTLPRVASVFVSAKVRAFPMAERDRALDWLEEA
jgi:hypothetical protein